MIGSKSNGVPDVIMDVNGLGGLHHQAVAYFIINLEHHDRAGGLVRKLDLFTGYAVFDDLAFLEYRQHVTNGKAIGATAIQDDDLVLPDLCDAANDRDDLPVDVARRCFRIKTSNPSSSSSCPI